MILDVAALAVSSEWSPGDIQGFSDFWVSTQVWFSEASQRLSDLAFLVLIPTDLLCPSASLWAKEKLLTDIQRGFYSELLFAKGNAHA
jgi:hypothetical protein